MNFDEVARKIVEDSIVSSLYIDDKVVQPFETFDVEDRYFKVSCGLYQSFRASNKSLDFFKFNRTASWRDKEDFIFKNRDLLVLDWQLDDLKDFNQSDTLDLLLASVLAENLHFVSVYTETGSERFNDIFYLIKSYMDEYYLVERREVYTSIIEFFDSQSIELKDLSVLLGNFKEMSLCINFKENLETIKKFFIDLLGREYSYFCKLLDGFAGDRNRSYEVFGYFLNNTVINVGNCRLDINFDLNFLNDNFIVINSTIIGITNKDSFGPNEYFDFFSKALVKLCFNPLTLTSLEIRNLLRKSSGFIGREASGIDELALYHHQEVKSRNFYYFIVELWKSQVLSYLDYNVGFLSTLNDGFWSDYHTQRNSKERLISLKHSKRTFHNELVKLNVYYNSLITVKNLNDKIRFGDVFSDSSKKFYLNITAHCDCEEPEVNIKNNFFFVVGFCQSDPEKSLQAGDSGFNSYLNLKGDLLTISWTNKPIVLNVQGRLEEGKILGKDGLGNDIILEYVKTLKESYAQRMANNSFAHAMRVGIDFVGLD